jgi:hypothetical protein
MMDVLADFAAYHETVDVLIGCFTERGPKVIGGGIA